jgi:hypothetical protein
MPTYKNRRAFLQSGAAASLAIAARSAGAQPTSVTARGGKPTSSSTVPGVADGSSIQLPIGCALPGIAFSRRRRPDLASGSICSLAMSHWTPSSMIW